MTARLSVVMPCYQQARFVEPAVRSVLSQSAEVELIVLDPGSKDGSRERLVALQAEFGPRLVLVFEPDAGQADAVNRGVARAQAPILGWLNSDDLLRPGAVARVLEELAGTEAAWLYGRAGMIDDQGCPITNWIARYKSFRGRRFSLTKLLTENFIPQMSVFWTRSLWDTVGGLDTSRELDMDYDLWLRFAKHVYPKVLNAALADFRVHADAKGSRLPGQQLASAWQTARLHAAGMGLRGRLALAAHRVLSLRTRIVYAWLKP